MELGGHSVCNLFTQIRIHIRIKGYLRLSAAIIRYAMTLIKPKSLIFISSYTLLRTTCVVRVHSAQMEVREEDEARLSPLLYGHINVLGHYFLS